VRLEAVPADPVTSAVKACGDDPEVPAAGVPLRKPPTRVTPVGSVPAGSGQPAALTAPQPPAAVRDEDALQGSRQAYAEDVGESGGVIEQGATTSSAYGGE